MKIISFYNFNAYFIFLCVVDKAQNLFASSEIKHAFKIIDIALKFIGWLLLFVIGRKIH